MSSSSEIRLRIGALLTRLSNPPRPPDPGAPDDRFPTAKGVVHHLRCLQDGATPACLETVARRAAGFGSCLRLLDLETGDTTEHHLLSSDALDLDANHVSLDSPLGIALVGRKVGAVVEVVTPLRTRRVRIVGLATLPTILDGLERREADAPTGADR